VDAGGQRIAAQRAKGIAEIFLDDVQGDFVTGALDVEGTVAADRRYVSDLAAALKHAEEGVGDVAGVVLMTDGRLGSFVDRNYDWAILPAARVADGGFVYATPPGVETTVTVPEGGTVVLGGQRARSFGALTAPALFAALGRNLGQKVVVNSTNLNVDASAAGGLGVRFTAGRNGVNYSVIDEAQLRTLLELDAKRAGAPDAVPANGRVQETIVGTDALLANGMLANARFAGDRGNTLDVNGNSIPLRHEKYILINNGAYLTAVRAGPMQHWTETPADVRFAEVPADIQVPPVGRLAKFEKTLVEPADKLVIQADYEWKGDRR